MKTSKFEAFLIIPAIILFLVGCSGSSDSTTENVSVISGKSLSGRGYLENAIVCLDSTGDFSCDDEAAEFVTISGKGGAFAISNVPEELLTESVGVIVETTEETISVMPGTGDSVSTGADKLLMASADMANEGEIYISPLMTLASVGPLAFGETLDFSEQMTLMGFHIEPDLNPNLDYLAYSGQSEAFIALGILNEIIFSDETYNLYLYLVENGLTNENDIDPAELEILRAYVNDVLEETDAAFYQETGESYEGVVDVDEIVAIVGPGARKDIGDGTQPQSQAAAPMRARADVDTGDYHDIITDHVQSWSNLVKGSVIGAVSLIPEVGETIGSFIQIVWPDSDPTEALLKQLYKDVNFLIEQQLIQAAMVEAQSELDLIRDYLAKYAIAAERGVDDEAIKYFDRALDHSEKTLARLAGAMSTSPGDVAYQLLPYSVMAFQITFLLQRDAYLYSDYFYPEAADPEATKRLHFETAMKYYKTYRDRFLGVNGQGGADALYNKFIRWRMSPPWVETKTGVYWRMLVQKFMYGQVRDNFDKSNFFVKYVVYNWRCPGGEGDDHYFRTSVGNVAQRLGSISTLQAAKTIAPIFFMPRLIPTPEFLEEFGLGDLAGELPPEAQGAKSIIIPTELLLIRTGPHSKSCIDPQGNGNHTVHNECRYPVQPEFYNGSPVNQLSVGFGPGIDHGGEEYTSDKYAISFHFNYQDGATLGASIDPPNQPILTKELVLDGDKCLTGFKTLYFISTHPIKFYDNSLAVVDMAYSTPGDENTAANKVISHVSYLGGERLKRNEAFAITDLTGSMNYQLTGLVMGSDFWLEKDNPDYKRIETVQLKYTFFADPLE